MAFCWRSAHTLHFKIFLPQLDTEAVFFIPFGYDVSHQVKDLDHLVCQYLKPSSIFSTYLGVHQLPEPHRSVPCSRATYKREKRRLHKTGRGGRYFLKGLIFSTTRWIVDNDDIFAYFPQLLGAVTQKDGRSCLLRAMCEVVVIIETDHHHHYAHLIFVATITTAGCVKTVGQM